MAGSLPREQDNRVQVLVHVMCLCSPGELEMLRKHQAALGRITVTSKYGMQMDANITGVHSLPPMISV